MYIQKEIKGKSKWFTTKKKIKHTQTESRDTHREGWREGSDHPSLSLSVPKDGEHVKVHQMRDGRRRRCRQDLHAHILHQQHFHRSTWWLNPQCLFVIFWIFLCGFLVDRIMCIWCSRTSVRTWSSTATRQTSAFGILLVCRLSFCAWWLPCWFQKCLRISLVTWMLKSNMCHVLARQYLMLDILSTYA